MFDLQTISENIITQIGFLILIIMVVRALVAYTREDWGSFISGVSLGILCLILVFFGPQIQEFARAVGNAIFS